MGPKFDGGTAADLQQTLAYEGLDQICPLQTKANRRLKSVQKKGWERDAGRRFLFWVRDTMWQNHR